MMRGLTLLIVAVDLRVVGVLELALVEPVTEAAEGEDADGGEDERLLALLLRGSRVRRQDGGCDGGGLSAGHAARVGDGREASRY